MMKLNITLRGDAHIEYTGKTFEMNLSGGVLTVGCSDVAILTMPINQITGMKFAEDTPQPTCKTLNDWPAGDHSASNIIDDILRGNGGVSHCASH